MDKICGIYKITSPSGGIYIGQSRDIKHRITTYCGKRCKDQPRLYNSIIKYGWESHIYEIISECQELELNKLEKHYIKFFNTFNTERGLNLTSGGESYAISEETKLKIGRAHKGKKLSPEHRLFLSNIHKGKKPSKENLEKLKIANTGRKCSDKTKEKLRIIHTGKKLSEETKEKLRIRQLGNKYWVGKKHSEESKIKISEAHKSVYEIYNQNNELIYKFKNPLRTELKKLKLPRDSFRNTYLHNEKIKRGAYKGWYIVKL